MYIYILCKYLPLLGSSSQTFILAVFVQHVLINNSLAVISETTEDGFTWKVASVTYPAAYGHW